MENVSQQSGLVPLRHVERTPSSMRKKAFRFTNVVMEKDRDTTKCYDSICKTYYTPNVYISKCGRDAEEKKKESRVHGYGIRAEKEEGQLSS